MKDTAKHKAWMAIPLTECLDRGCRHAHIQYGDNSMRWCDLKSHVKCPHLKTTKEHNL